MAITAVSWLGFSGPVTGSSQGCMRRPQSPCHQGKHNRDTPHFHWTRGQKLGTGNYIVRKQAPIMLHESASASTLDASTD